MKVLVVDDSTSIRELICAYVRDIGHTPIGANNGFKALDLLGQEAFDLVLMDVEMPGIDGFETTKRMRIQLGSRWIPIIFLSSTYNEHHFTDGIDAGGDAYLAKPVNGRVLQSMVRAMSRIAAMQAELARANNELERLADIDALTELMNRRGFARKLDREWQKLKETGLDLSVILLDVDQFKQYNDNYGHLKGDDCLKQVAKVLADNVNGLKPHYTVARYGGEEFVVVLPQTPLAAAKEVAEVIRKAVEAQKIVHEHSLVGPYVTVSLGVATSLDEVHSSAELVDMADKNLYRAKVSGRNNVQG